MKNKKRLDLLVHEKYPQYSRQQIQSFIMQGLVTVNMKIVIKPGTSVADDIELGLTIKEERFVSRAGCKLEQALNFFHIDVRDLVVLDAGISTGGFTDCLLQQGAKKVYGIDVGYGQVHEKIRHDPRLVLLERTNLRLLTGVGELVDLVTLDLSFISVLKVMDAVRALLKPDGKLVVLIKPQFESERRDIGRGGIIKDSLVHDRVVKQVVAGIEACGFACQGVTESPIFGSSGNKEFLAYFLRHRV